MGKAQGPPPGLTRRAVSRNSTPQPQVEWTSWGLLHVREGGLYMILICISFSCGLQGNQVAANAHLGAGISLGNSKQPSTPARPLCAHDCTA